MNTPEAKKLDVSDYTNAVEGLLDFLKSKEVFDQKEFDFFNQKTKSDKEQQEPFGVLHISDVRDVFGRQCVDLVQEGGGVHGIALAGYTYVLEKMGIIFLKAAGTSAGAINNMLLNSVLTDFEFEKIKDHREETPHYQRNEIKTRYYPTRSEKLLEYLAGKDIREVIDGHTSWKGLLLNLFRGKVDFRQVKALFKTYKRLAITAAVSLIVLVIGSFFLVWDTANRTAEDIIQGIVLVSLIVFLIATRGLVADAVKGRRLWANAKHLGINQGDDFQQWIDNLLRQNQINTIHSLREKMELETKVLKPAYDLALAKREHPSKANDKNKTEYKVIGDESDEAFYKEEISHLKNLIKGLNAGDIEKDKRKRKAEEAWDRLIRLATNLPVGSTEADLVAERRALELKSLFEDAIFLQDQTCNYSPNEKGEYNTGPYNRELTVVAADITNEMKVEFPAMHKMYWGNNLDISPACYVRASMAIPFFFTPFKVENKEEQTQTREREWLKFMKVIKRKDTSKQGGEDATLFVDGGTLSNFPINIYATPEMPMPRKPTLGIKLEYEDESIANVINTEVGVVGSIISTMRFFYDRDFLAKNDMYKRTVRSIDTGEIHWLNFGLSEENKLELFVRGAISASLFLVHTHPAFEENRGIWINMIKSYGKQVKCEKLPSPLNIYKKENQKDDGSFRHEDLENEDIHYRWQEYKKERILAISRTRYQRDQLKRFPE